MALWLGIMRLAETSGLVVTLARWLRPVMTRLFPEVPPDHPAMGAMMMNCAANMIGVGDAATPLGLRAMAHLQKLNPFPGTASNAMCTFLAINTSSIQLIPASIVAMIAARPGAQNPTAIVGTALVATICSTVVGITAVKLLERLPCFAARPGPEGEGAKTAMDTVGICPRRRGGLRSRSRNRRWRPPCPRRPPAGRGSWFGACSPSRRFSRSWAGGCCNRPHPGASRFKSVIDVISLLAMPGMLVFFPVYAWFRGVSVYDEFVEGAKDGFHTAVRIIPYLVAMLVAVGMFRGAGGVDLISQALRPVLEAVHFPVELLPLSLMRPLSGSASRGLFADILNQYGPDHFLTRTAGTIMGSTETTLYVIMVYFGAVAIRRTRHAIWAGLIADLAGVIASVVVCRLVFGG